MSIDIEHTNISTDITKEGTTIEMPSSVKSVDIEEAQSLLEVTKKEYSIVGDGLYASVSADDAPQWLLSIIDAVLTARLDSSLSNLNNAITSINNALDSIDIAENQYQELINIEATIEGIISTRLSSINATVDNNTATIAELETTKTTPEEAVAIAAERITSELNNGAIKSAITHLNAAISTLDESTATSITTLNSVLADQNGDIIASANAVTTLNTQVGITDGVPDGTGLLQDVAILQAQIDGVVETWSKTYSPNVYDDYDFTETSDTTTAVYAVDDRIYQSTSGSTYKCILANTIGVLLTNATYFEDITASADNYIGAPADVEPYATWLATDTTNANTVERDLHTGDTFIYYDNAGGNQSYIAGFRFAKGEPADVNTDADGFGWFKIIDSVAENALAQALEAYDLADGKRRVFIALNDPITENIDIGDVLIIPSDEYTVNGKVFTGSKKGDIYRANTSSSSGDSLVVSYWSEVSSYQTAINTLSTQVATDIGNLETSINATIDGKIDTYYQDTPPYANVTTPGAANTNSGDLWYCTKDNTPYTAGTVYEFTEAGTPDNYTYTWEVTTEFSNSLFDLADGKRRVFVEKPEASGLYTSAIDVGDLWLVGSDYVPSGRVNGQILRSNTTQLLGAAYSDNHWEPADKYAERLDNAEGSLGTQLAQITNLEAIRDGNIIIYYSPKALEDLEVFEDYGLITAGVTTTSDYGLVVDSITNTRDKGAVHASQLNYGDYWLDEDSITEGYYDVYFWDNTQWILSQSGTAKAISDLYKTNLQIVSISNDITTINTDLAAKELELANLDGKITAEEAARVQAILDEQVARAADIADRVEAEALLDGKITAEELARIQASQDLEDAYQEYSRVVAKAMSDEVLTQEEIDLIAVAQAGVDAAKAKLASMVTATTAAQQTADGRAKVWYQNTDPSLDVENVDYFNTTDSIGDYWVDTDNANYTTIWTGNATGWQDSTGLADTKVANIIAGITQLDLSEHVNSLGWQTASEVSTAASTTLNTWVTNTYDSDQLAVQTALDGKVESYFTTNGIEPYDATTATADKDGDLWYDTTTKLLKRLVFSTKQWTTVEDQAAIDAAAAASQAQSTADGKIVTFLSPTAPTAKAVGDIWVDTDDSNHMYRWDGFDWISVRDTKNDSTLATALADISTLEETNDGIVNSFYQTSAPVSGITYGDWWVDTDANPLKAYRYEDIDGKNVGTLSWVDNSDGIIGKAYIGAVNAQSTADGKIVTFFQNTVPTSEGLGDLWINPDDNNKTYRAAIKGADQVITGEWERVTDDSALDNFLVATYAVDISDIQNQIDGKSVSYFQDTEPYAASVGTASQEGDIWYNRSTSELKVFHYDVVSPSWDLITDPYIQGAYDDAATAQATADGKIQNFTAEPTHPYYVGDTWMQGVGGDIYVANADSASVFNQSDWTLASKYTDDTAANKTSISNSFEGEEFNEWTASAQNTITAEVSDRYEGTTSALITSTLDSTEAVSGGKTNTVYLELSEYFAKVNAGYKVKVSMYAKQPLTNASDEFAVTYATFANGNSGWNKFTPTTSWAKYEFLYDVPELGDLSSDYVGIWADTSGLGKGILVDSVVIERVDNTAIDNLNAYIAVVDPKISTLQNQVDGTITGWVQEADPKTAWTTDILKEQHHGDVWYKDDGTSWRYDYQIDDWVTAPDLDQISLDANAYADGKASVWYGTSNDRDYIAGISGVAFDDDTFTKWTVEEKANNVGDVWYVPRVQSTDDAGIDREATYSEIVVPSSIPANTELVEVGYRWSGANWFELKDGKTFANAENIIALDTKIGDIGAETSVVSFIETTESSLETKIKTGWEYDTITVVNGSSYKAGFGLNTNYTGTGTELDPYTSDFWINAERFKFTNDAQSGTVAPFTIDASGATPQVTFNGVVSFTNVTDTTNVVQANDDITRLNNNAGFTDDTTANIANSTSNAALVSTVYKTGTTTIDGGNIATDTVSANVLKAGTNGSTVWTGGALVSSDFNGNVSGNIGAPTAGFRLSSNAAGTEDDPDIYGAYIRGASISADDIISGDLARVESTIENIYKATGEIGTYTTPVTTNLSSVSYAVKAGFSVYMTIAYGTTYSATTLSQNEKFRLKTILKYNGVEASSYATNQNLYGRLAAIQGTFVVTIPETSVDGTVTLDVEVGEDLIDIGAVNFAVTTVISKKISST